MYTFWCIKINALIFMCIRIESPSGHWEFKLVKITVLCRQWHPFQRFSEGSFNLCLGLHGSPTSKGALGTCWIHITITRIHVCVQEATLVTGKTDKSNSSIPPSAFLLSAPLCANFLQLPQHLLLCCSSLRHGMGICQSQWALYYSESAQ